MLEDKDWIELLDYLLKRLNEMGAGDFANEVRVASAARLAETETKPEFGILASHYRDVGSMITRAPTPKEAILHAIEAMRIRLEMLPDVGLRLTKSLERKPANIIWRSERQESQFRSNETNFAASDILLSPKDRDTISSMLDRLTSLIEQA